MDERFDCRNCEHVMQMLELHGVPRDRARHPANGLDVLTTRLRRESQFREAALQSAVDCLREIADMGKKAGSETATNWLQQHGIPREEGGYVPGKGFSDCASEKP